MREADFERFLDADSNITSKDKAVRSRMSKARKIEQHFYMSLDAVVADDNMMYDILSRIKNELSDYNGAISNALRKYYLFVHGHEFPRLCDFR
jgi:predicted DNA-binding ribbon-helix-helix protein